MNTSQSIDAAEIEALPGIEDLVEYIQKSECILFLGSAIHSPPPPNSRYKYPDEVRPASVGELVEKLAQKCRYRETFGSESPVDLQRVSLCFKTTPALGSSRLVDMLNDLLRESKEPSAVLKMLASLPFKIIVTTNYDQLLEKALRSEPNSKIPTVCVYNPNDKDKTPDFKPKDLDKQHPLLFKMHGDLDHRDSIVITDEDYINFIRRMSTTKVHIHPIPGIIRETMKERPTLFIGYSLKDYNLRLMFRTLRWGLDNSEFPVSYSIDRKPDLLIKRVWQDQGGLVAFIAEDIWTFVPWLYKKINGKEFEG